MTECRQLTDRMPAVAHGREAWSADDLAHLAGCPDCAAEWDLVSVASRLGEAPEPAFVARLADRVVEGLRDHPRVVPLFQRRAVRWIAGAAAAAAVIMAVWLRPVTRAPVEEAFGLLPEIEQLDADGLRSMLEILPGDETWSPLAFPRGLSDLTEEELERVLRSLEG
jgi:hypothetical protein